MGPLPATPLGPSVRRDDGVVLCGTGDRRCLQDIPPPSPVIPAPPVVQPPPNHPSLPPVVPTPPVIPGCPPVIPANAGIQRGWVGEAARPPSRPALPVVQPPPSHLNSPSRPTPPSHPSERWDPEGLGGGSSNPTQSKTGTGTNHAGYIPWLRPNPGSVHASVATKRHTK